VPSIKKGERANLELRQKKAQAESGQKEKEGGPCSKMVHAVKAGEKKSETGARKRKCCVRGVRLQKEVGEDEGCNFFLGRRQGPRGGRKG